MPQIIDLTRVKALQRVERYPHAHEMHGHTGRAQTGCKRIVDILDIAERGIEFVETVLAQEAFDLDAPDMGTTSRRGGSR